MLKKLLDEKSVYEMVGGIEEIWDHKERNATCDSENH